MDLIGADGVATPLRFSNGAKRFRSTSPRCEVRSFLTCCWDARLTCAISSRAGYLETKVASLFQPSHRHFAILNPARSTLIKPGHLVTTCSVTPIAAFVEVLDCLCRVSLYSLTHQIALPQASATAPPSKVARLFE
jgi:hypothetical protein